MKFKQGKNGRLIIRLQRVLELYRVALGGVDLGKFAASRGVNIRTVQRDIKLLGDAGYPIKPDGKGKYKTK